MNFKQFFCSHSTVEIARRHASTVTDDIRPKTLYVDRLNVYNFVRCVECKKLFNTKQTEKLFDTKEIE